LRKHQSLEVYPIARKFPELLPKACNRWLPLIAVKASTVVCTTPVDDVVDQSDGDQVHCSAIGDSTSARSGSGIE
jgi:hypothetical protein